MPWGVTRSVCLQVMLEDGRSIVFGAAINPAPDQQALPFRQFLAVVGHSDMARRPAFDQDVEIADKCIARF